MNNCTQSSTTYDLVTICWYNYSRTLLYIRFKFTLEFFSGSENKTSKHRSLVAWNKLIKINEQVHGSKITKWFKLLQKDQESKFTLPVRPTGLLSPSQSKRVNIRTIFYRRNMTVKDFSHFFILSLFCFVTNIDKIRNQKLNVLSTFLAVRTVLAVYMINITKSFTLIYFTYTIVQSQVG